MEAPTMPDTIFTAPQYNPARERKKKIIFIVTICAIALAAILAFWFRNWPEEHAVNKFFDALVQQDYKTAYGIWQHDPNWQQHPQKYSGYPFEDFYRDWGPGGDFGLIKTHRVDCAASPPGGNGVVVVEIINNRVDKARIFVLSSDKTLSFSPYEVVCHGG